MNRLNGLRRVGIGVVGKNLAMDCSTKLSDQCRLYHGKQPQPPQASPFQLEIQKRCWDRLVSLLGLQG